MIDIPILGRPKGGVVVASRSQAKPVIRGRIEIARSFSYKVTDGNYGSRDWFMSQKAECAAEDAEKVSEALYAFCKQQVLKSVAEYTAHMKQQRRTA